MQEAGTTAEEVGDEEDDDPQGLSKGEGCIEQHMQEAERATQEEVEQDDDPKELS